LKKLVLPAAVAAGFVASAFLLGWLSETYLQGMSAGAVFSDANVITRLAMLALMMAYLPITGLATADLVTGRGVFRTPLTILGLFSLGLGGLGALYAIMVIQQAVAAVGPVSFAVTASGYAEAALSAALGFAGAAFAFGARAFGDRRPKVSVREA
jgi:hypothetical protein